MKTDTSKDSTRLEVINLKDDLKVPESPEDWIEYYSHVKKTLDVDIDFFIDASDDMVISGKELELVDSNLWDKKFPRPNLEPGVLDKILKEKIPDTFCLYPFRYLNIDPDGRGRPCCKYAVGESWKEDARLPNDNIKDLFNQQYIKNLKKEFLEGKKPKACKACWDEEDAGMMSMRQMDQYGGKEFPTTTWFKNILLESPTRIDFKLSSICNGKCRICSAFLSTKWLQEEEDIGLLGEEVLKSYRLNAKEKFITNPENIEILKHWAPTIQEINFFGGEPLLQSEHNLILKTMVETGYTENIVLYYNTNGSIYDEKICNYWENFKKVELNYSIDDIGERFNYQRYPANYNDVMDNIKKYYKYTIPNERMLERIIGSKKYFYRFFSGGNSDWLDEGKYREYPTAEILRGRGFKIPMINRIYITVSLFNIFYLDEILREHTTKWNMALQFNPVHFPHYYAINILPNRLKDIIKKKLTEPTFVEEMSNKYIKCDPVDDVNEEIDHLIKLMYSTPENPELIKEALQNIKIHDGYRGQEFSKICPEIYEFLKEYE
jgi:organic radical activating enzyme